MPKTPPERLTLILDRIDTPVGQVLLVTDADGVVRALDFHDFEPRMRRLLARHCGAFELVERKAPAEVRDAVLSYFSGEARALDQVKTRTAGTAFQRAVWSALRAIPPGQTRTYAQIAQTVGSPRAVRATGMANGQNPIALIVPCHRVIGANGTLTGYAGGVERKRWLLAHECTILP
ncbi:MAG: methylated-DNA--[protein]-cysteine S-methyltransferase [Brevundimonas sp.]|uniref:methylated-DNA--[protein]-cysteine S-methyltransferase n=1 Tax=Brevundimonas sp. TaxID=1871086 RepID=UPI001A33561C|nr:methylated-DNA--[protein]-cysteine S-methyltransferase [Brevundimonas sp.]MBJ7446806.1 methylated-DNA--[protein]-cysteine S-methyltransferase [Brevundimonas sp.]